MKTFCMDLQGGPVPLREGSMLHFAASSREYVLRLEAAPESEPQHDSTAANAAAEPPVRPSCTACHLQGLHDMEPRVCVLWHPNVCLDGQHRWTPMVVTVEIKPRQVRGILGGLYPSHSACIARAETHNAHGVF